MNDSTTFKDKTLMITGGTGSFGNTVLKHFMNTDLAEIRIFSRDEKKQDDMRHRLQERSPELASKVRIVQLVRGLNMTPQEFAAFVRGGALQAAPAPIPDFEQEDNAHEEI